MIAFDAIGPDLTSDGFAHIQRLVVGTEIDAVGNAHLQSRTRHDLSLAFAVGITRDAPDSAGLGAPRRVARIERPVGRDGDIVWLVEGRLKIDLRRGLIGFEHENPVRVEGGHVHATLPVETDTAASALDRRLALRGRQYRQHCELLRHVGARLDTADRAGLAEIDYIEVAVRIDGGAFDLTGIFIGRGESLARYALLRDRHYRAARQCGKDREYQ